MARENFILKTLLETGQVSWNPKGNSMTGEISSGDLVLVKKVKPTVFRVGDIVYAKVKGNYYLHLISAINKDKIQISNNHNFVNGLTSIDNVFGICVQVKDKVILSDEDIEKRLNEQ